MPMETPTPKFPVPLAAQVLKMVSLIMILTFFADLVVLLLTPQFDNPQWQLNLITQMIDRGVTPLVGFGLFYAGLWIQVSTGAGGEFDPNRSPWRDLRFWAFVLSSLLGLLFLLVIPLVVSSTGQISKQAIAQIQQQGTQAELRITQEKTRLQQIAASGQIDQLLKSNQLNQEQVARLQQLQQDPQALEKEAGQLREQVRTSQEQAIKQAQNETLLTRLRSGLRSFLLAIGFITIGWSGIRESQ
jgi:hypothetical protein